MDGVITDAENIRQENQRLQVIIDKKQKVLESICNHNSGPPGSGWVDMPADLWKKVHEAL